MEIIARNLLRYLADRGLLSRKAIVDGGVSLALSRSRNRFAVIRQRDGPGYFLKQTMGEPMGALSIAREAEVYRRAAGDPPMAGLRALLPPFHDFDADKGILITGYVPEAENLTFLHERLNAFPPSLGRRTGEALAILHKVRFAEGDEPPSCFAREPHWILRLHAGNPADLRRSPGASQVIDFLLAAPGLADRLAWLREGWTCDTLIHADMRWENILVAPKRAPLDRQTLLLIDWELADLGDPAWDVGGIFQAYLNSWIASMPPDAGMDTVELAARATRPLAAIQPAVAAFWDAYRAGRGDLGQAPAGFLERAAAMMAARMLVTSVEISMRGHNVDPRVALMLRTARNVLERPAEAAVDLLWLAE